MSSQESSGKAGAVGFKKQSRNSGKRAKLEEVFIQFFPPFLLEAQLEEVFIQFFPETEVDAA